MPDSYVLDAFALLALFSGEPGADRVAAIVENERNLLHVSAVNVGEVYYILQRTRGQHVAREAEATIFEQPNLQVVEATWERIRSAAELKAEGGLSFADSFAAALSLELSAPLVTGDLEFAELERRGAIRVEWLPRE